MAVPIPDLRVNFDGLGFSRLYQAGIPNSGFEVDANGWSVLAGIQAAGSTITRVTSAVYMGVGAGRLVTTSTNGSGVKYVMATTFTSGVTYRFRVFLKSISGATTCGIRIGSLGTAGDRAVSTFTVTTTWTAYSVDFTPSADRADIQVNVYTNSAAAMTVDIDDAEVYAVRDDIGASCDLASYNHGANFEGGLIAGQLTLSLRNDTQQFTNGATAITPGLRVLLRASYAGVPYGLFYGVVERVTANAAERRLDIICGDVADVMGRAEELNEQARQDTVVQFRTSALGSTSTIPNLLGAHPEGLTSFEAESDIIYWGWDHGHTLDLLKKLDEATGTVGFISFKPDPDLPFLYTTIARNARSAQASAETISETFTGIGWELNDDQLITDQRVNYTAWKPDPAGDQLISTYESVPFAISNGDTLDLWGAFLPVNVVFQGTEEVTFNGPALVSAAPTVTETGAAEGAANAYWRTWLIQFDASGGASTVSEVSWYGTPLLDYPGSVLGSKAGATNRVFGSDITSEAIGARAVAQGLADWMVNHIPANSPKIDVTLTNIFPTILARQVCDLITVTMPVVASGSPTVLIRSIDTTIDMGANQWTTKYGLEPSGIPTNGQVLILNTSTLNNAASKLGY